MTRSQMDRPSRNPPRPTPPAASLSYPPVRTSAPHSRGKNSLSASSPQTKSPRQSSPRFVPIEQRIRMRSRAAALSVELRAIGACGSAGLAPEDVLVYVERCNGRRNRPKGNGEYRCPEPKCTFTQANHQPPHRTATLIINKSSNHL